MSKPDLTFTFPETIWAGTNESLAAAREFHAGMMAGLYTPEEEPAEVPYNFTQQGNVGVISIRGALVNNDSYWNRYRGVTSYADISRALIYAAQKADVGAILLDIDSGGGAVSGVADTADLIASVDKSLKPVYSYSGGAMASAAYWLGVSARAVYVSKTTLSGSIGILSTHQEYSKALKEAGIGVTVMRAGEYKALVNSVEPLSDKAKRQMQDQLNAAYEVFASHCASQLGVSMETFEASMGQGREFFGVAAVEAGLAKGVKTFDAMVSLVEAKAIDSIAKKGNTATHYPSGVNMTRQALTEQDIAALAAGGVAAPAGATAAPAAADAAAQAAAVAAAAAAAAAAGTAAPAAPAAPAAAAAAPAAAPATQEVTQSQEANALVAFLQGQLRDKDTAFVAQSIELNGLKSKLASVEATHNGLVKIAAASLSNMKVAMGMTKADFSAMAPEALLAEHASTAAVFAAKFVPGGVAAVSSKEGTQAAAASKDLDPAVAELVQANRHAARK